MVPLAGAGADVRGATRRCTTRCRCTGRVSRPRRSGPCGSSLRRCTRWAPTSAASCSTTSVPTSARARPSSATRSSPRRRQAIPILPRGSAACASGRRPTRWGTPSIWPTRGRSRSARRGSRSKTSPAAFTFMNYPYRVPPGPETRVLPELRVPLQRQRAAVHAPRAVSIRPARQRAVVRRPRFPKRQHAGGFGVPARGARQPPEGRVRVPGADGRRAQAQQRVEPSRG